MSAVSVAQDSRDDDCSMVWVNVYGDAPSTASVPVSSSTAATQLDGYMKAADNPSVSSSPMSSGTVSALAAATSAGTSNTASITSGTSPTASNCTGISMPALPNGELSLVIKRDYLFPPAPTDAIPSDAATYTPPDSTKSSGAAFDTWIKGLNPSLRWTKIAPGPYNHYTNDRISFGI